MTNPAIPTEPLHIQTLKRADEMGEPPWLDLLLVNDRSQLAMKGDLPGGLGGSTDDHIHYDFIEWWIVLEGELTFEIGDYPLLTARKHDIVTSPFGTRHLITSAGEGRSVRLIVGYPGSEHYADDPDHTKKRGPVTIPFPESESQGPPNLIHTNLDELIASKGEPPWTEVVVKNEHVKGTLICHGPGMSNTPHWHDDITEWWLLLKGEISYNYSRKREPFHMREGDVVFMPTGVPARADDDRRRAVAAAGRRAAGGALGLHGRRRGRASAAGVGRPLIPVSSTGRSGYRLSPV